MNHMPSRTLDQETLTQLLDTVRRFVRARLIPAEEDVVANNRIPSDIIEEMKGMGLFGLSVPQEYGGLGLSMLEECEVVFALCEAAPAFRSVLGTNNGIGAQGIVMDGTEAQKQKYLPGVASGEIIASFALTEPDAGSDAQSIRTSATKVDGGWVINGAKRYITNAPYAGLFTLMAKTGERQKGRSDHITAFLVPGGTKGITVGPPDKKMGQRGAISADVYFEDCFVPDDAVLGARPGQGFRTAMKVLDRGRLHLSAVCCGVAERLIAEAVGYAQERKQFGNPIASFQLVQAMIAENRVDTYAGKSMVRDAAQRYDAGERVSQEAACCKLFCSEMVGRVADRAVQIHGGAGYMADYPVERLYRDVRLFRIYEGTSEIQKLVIARNELAAFEG